MQYSNYSDTDDSARLQPVDASTPAPPASFSGAYRPSAPAPLDLSSSPPQAIATAAYRPAPQPGYLQSQPAPVAVEPAVVDPVAVAATAPRVSIVKQIGSWFRGKHVAIGAAVAIVLVGGGLFASRSLHHQTTANAAAVQDAPDPAITRSIDDNFQRLDGGLSAIETSLVEQSGDLAE
jgi:hypothetical protein